MPWYNEKRKKWIGRVMVDGERRQVGEFETKKDALAGEVKYRKEREDLTGTLSVDGLYAEWCKDGAGRWSRATEIGYQHKTSAFRKKYGKRGSASFEMRDAMVWHRDRPHDTDALRAMFGYGRRLGVLLRNPFEELRSPVPAKDQEFIVQGRGALSLDEVEALALFAARSGDWLAAVIRFAAFTGLRIGEVVRVRHQDISPNRLSVEWAWNSTTDTVERPKGNKTRVVVCPPQAYEAAKRAPRSTVHPEVFLNPETGNPFVSDALRGYFRDARTLFMASLPADHWISVRDRLAREQQAREGKPLRGSPLMFHELRHTCATLLLDAGATYDDVAIQLGHSDDKLVRKVYGHPNRERQLDRVAAVFGRVGSKSGLRAVDAADSGFSVGGMEA